MMAQCQEPVQFPELGFIYDEPEDPVRGNYPVLETGFSELGEVLSQFQAGSSSGSGASRAVYTVNERKRRRMVSNRESARRSRWRKKTHMQNKAAELNRLRFQNREFKNRFSTAVCLNQMVRRDNDRLEAEVLVLYARLSNLSQVLLARQQMLNW